jgi:YbgC/YbaW family acyl-CoA thioester hydrolase
MIQTPMETPLFEASRTVLFQDVDAAGIVFFPRVLEYFHDAYVAHLAARGVDVSRVLAEGVWGAPIAHAEADYKRPLRFGDPITVVLSAARLGETSLTVDYRIHAPGEPARVYCTGRTVHVFIDRQSFRPRPLPSEVRAAFTTSTAAAHR